MKNTRISNMILSLALLGPAVLMLGGCSSGPAPAKKAAAKKPAVPVTGQSAIFQMYQIARTWAPDAMLLKLESGTIEEVAPEPGKYGLWRATFISQTKRTRRDYQFAAADSSGGVIKGARAGSEGSYSRNPRIHPLAIQEVKIDTPAALAAALKEVDKDPAMKKVLAENKDLPVLYLLDWTGTDAKPTWRVIFGPSIAMSKFSLYIDAYTGNFVKKAR